MTGLVAAVGVLPMAGIRNGGLAPYGRLLSKNFSVMNLLRLDAATELELYDWRSFKACGCYWSKDVFVLVIMFILPVPPTKDLLCSVPLRILVSFTNDSLPSLSLNSLSMPILGY